MFEPRILLCSPPPRRRGRPAPRVASSSCLLLFSPSRRLPVRVSPFLALLPLHVRCRAAPGITLPFSTWHFQHYPSFCRRGKVAFFSRAHAHTSTRKAHAKHTLGCSAWNAVCAPCGVLAPFPAPVPPSSPRFCPPHPSAPPLVIFKRGGLAPPPRSPPFPPSSGLAGARYTQQRGHALRGGLRRDVARRLGGLLYKLEQPSPLWPKPFRKRYYGWRG